MNKADKVGIEKISREILFKAKRTDNAEWVEGFYLLIDDKAYIICEAELDCSDGENTDLYATEWYEVKPETVFQYVGPDNRTGRKIFEWAGLMKTR